MKRRTLLKIGLLASLTGLVPKSLYADKEPVLIEGQQTWVREPFDFEEFFKIANGFEMNISQKVALNCNIDDSFQNNLYWMRQCGATTMMATMALYDYLCLDRTSLVITHSHHMVQYHHKLKTEMVERLNKHFNVNNFQYNKNDFPTISIQSTFLDCNCRGRNFDTLYIEDDANFVSKHKSYKDLMACVVPVLSCRKKGKIITMATYEYYDIPAPNYAGKPDHIKPKLNYKYKFM